MSERTKGIVMECTICKNEFEGTADVCWQCVENQQKIEAQNLSKRKRRTRNLIIWAVVVAVIAALVVIYLNSDKRQIQGAWVTFHEALDADEIIVYSGDWFASATRQGNVKTETKGTFTLENGRMIVVYKSYKVVEDPDNKAMQQPLIPLNTPYVAEYEVSRSLLVLNGIAYVRLTKDSEAEWGR